MSTTDCPHCKGICLGLCGSATPSPSPDLVERLKVEADACQSEGRVYPERLMREAASELSRLRADNKAIQCMADTLATNNDRLRAELDEARENRDSHQRVAMKAMADLDAIQLKCGGCITPAEYGEALASMREALTAAKIDLSVIGHHIDEHSFSLALGVIAQRERAIDATLREADLVDIYDMWPDGRRRWTLTAAGRRALGAEDS